MKKLLVVVDMQKDFIDGALGTSEAVDIVDPTVQEILSFDGDIVYTLDTHFENYLLSAEGKKLPVTHCVKGTAGWEIDNKIKTAFENKNIEPIAFEKFTFGSLELGEYIKTKGYDYVQFVGLCTDICVISNVLITKACCPEITISVKADCCAGVTKESHNNALQAMKMCQIDII